MAYELTFFHPLTGNVETRSFSSKIDFNVFCHTNRITIDLVLRVIEDRFFEALFSVSEDQNLMMS